MAIRQKFILVAVMAAVLGWLAVDLANKTNNPEKSPTVQTSRPASAPVPSLPKALPANKSGAPAPSKTYSPASIGYTADRYAIPALAGLERLAANPDPIAAAYAADLIASCTHFSDAQYEQTVRNIDRGTAPAGVKKLQVEMARQHRERCHGIGASHQAVEAQLRERAALAKDVRALPDLARTSKMTAPELAALAKAGAATRDPLALRAIGLFFAAQPGNVPVDLGEGHMASAWEIRDAWFLAACDVGEPCDRTNAMMAMRCVLSASCDAHTLEESLLRYSYTPASAETLLRARSVIVRGMATGEWPQRFWGGRP